MFYKIAQIKFLLLSLLRAFALMLLAFSFLAKPAMSQGVIPITTDSRIKTLVYNPNEVYELKFHYGYQSFIEFSEGEAIEMISMGESFAWRLTPADRRLFIRPLEIAAHTNMTIITNLRTYQFDIRSAEYDGKADEELVYVVRFFYPELRAARVIPKQLIQPKNDPAMQVAPQAAAMSSMSAMPMGGFAQAAPPARGSQSAYPGVIRSRAEELDLTKDLTGMLALNDRKNKINFDYQFAGNAPNITPIKVYDNGQETSFQFKANNLIVPFISVVDPMGNEIPVKYVNKDNYIVIPSVAGQFTLRLDNSLLCVFNNKAISEIN